MCTGLSIPGSDARHFGDLRVTAFAHAHARRRLPSPIVNSTWTTFGVHAVTMASTSTGDSAKRTQARTARGSAARVTWLPASASASELRGDGVVREVGVRALVGRLVDVRGVLVADGQWDAPDVALRVEGEGPMVAMPPVELILNRGLCMRAALHGRRDRRVHVVVAGAALNRHPCRASDTVGGSTPSTSAANSGLRGGLD